MEEKDLEKLVLRGLEIEFIEKEKAAERKALTRKNGIKKEDAKYSDTQSGQTRDIIGKQLGISGKQWEHMRFIYQHKEYISKEDYDSWRERNLSTSKIYSRIRGIVKSEKQISIINRRFDKIIKGNMNFPNKDERIYNFKKELSLYNYPDRIKKEILRALDNSEQELEYFLDKQYGDLIVLRDEIDELYSEIEKIKNNAQWNK